MKLNIHFFKLNEMLASHVSFDSILRLLLDCYYIQVHLQFATCYTRVKLCKHYVWLLLLSSLKHGATVGGMGSFSSTFATQGCRKDKCYKDSNFIDFPASNFLFTPHFLFSGTLPESRFSRISKPTTILFKLHYPKEST